MRQRSYGGDRELTVRMAFTGFLLLLVYTDISHINRNSPYHPAGVPNRMLLVDGWQSKALLQPCQNNAQGCQIQGSRPLVAI